MKLSEVKARIDTYFDSVSPKEIVHRLEARGFEFAQDSTTDGFKHDDQKPDHNASGGQMPAVDPNIKD